MRDYRSLDGSCNGSFVSRVTLVHIYIYMYIDPQNTEVLITENSKEVPLFFGEAPNTGYKLQLKMRVHTQPQPDR